MARPLRIEYKGAFYHITARGNERKRIFFSKVDYDKFKDYLGAIGVRPTQLTDMFLNIKGSAVDSCIKLIRDTADLPHHSKVISIVEGVKQEIGRNRNFKKRINELTRNLNKSQRQT